MAEMMKLTASDGHKLDAYLAQPAGAPKGGIVVIQEIFGVNSTSGASWTTTRPRAIW